MVSQRPTMDLHLGQLEKTSFEKVPKKSASKVWTYFKICEDNLMLVKCQICGARVKRGGRDIGRVGTSNLYRHLRDSHKMCIPNARLRVAPKIGQSKLLTSSEDEMQTEDDLSTEHSDPEMCIKWKTYLSNMTATLPDLMMDEQYVDCTLACEGRSLKCHKIILAACSPYLHELLSETACQHPIIVFNDFSFSELEALVSFIYHGEVSVPQSQLSKLLIVAEALQIKGLAAGRLGSKVHEDSEASNEESPATSDGNEEIVEHLDNFCETITLSNERDEDPNSLSRGRIQNPSSLLGHEVEQKIEDNTSVELEPIIPPKNMIRIEKITPNSKQNTTAAAMPLPFRRPRRWTHLLRDNLGLASGGSGIQIYKGLEASNKEFQVNQDKKEEVRMPLDDFNRTIKLRNESDEHLKSPALSLICQRVQPANLPIKLSDLSPPSNKKSRLSPEQVQQQIKGNLEVEPTLPLKSMIRIEKIPTDSSQNSTAAYTSLPFTRPRRWTHLLRDSLESNQKKEAERRPSNQSQKTNS